MANIFRNTIWGICIAGTSLLMLSGVVLAAETPMTKRQYLQNQNKDRTIEPSERSCGRYLDMIDSLYKGNRSAKNQFKSLRQMYARCTFYDPFAEDTLRNMAGLREKVNGDDPLESTKALRTYKNLVRRHLVNLDVLNMALDIGKEDSRFGNPDFFREVRTMITDSLIDVFTDGTEPGKAIEIITVGEQNYIIASAGGKLVDSELIKEGGIFYYALDFQKNENSEKFAIFLNVSTPMIVARTKQKEAEKQQSLGILGAP